MGASVRGRQATTLAAAGAAQEQRMTGRARARVSPQAGRRGGMVVAWPGGEQCGGRCIVQERDKQRKETDWIWKERRKGMLTGKK